LIPLGPGVGGEKFYPTLSIQKILDLPIADLTADNSQCLLWVPNTQLLATAIRAVEGWGFVLRNVITWVKNKPGRPTRYLQSNTELLLFCTRGDAPARVRGQQTVIFAPIQAHSQKPDEQYAIAERVANPPFVFVELFARERPHALSSSWLVWGMDQPDSDLTIPALPIPADFLKEAQS
jgi:N6-adenosine-specific RNA methylase IME4